VGASVPPTANQAARQATARGGGTIKRRRKATIVGWCSVAGRAGPAGAQRQRYMETPEGKVAEGKVAERSDAADLPQPAQRTEAKRVGDMEPPSPPPPRERAGAEGPPAPKDNTGADDPPHQGAGAQDWAAVPGLVEASGRATSIARALGGRHLMLSYQWDEQAHVSLVAQQLRQRGLPCWCVQGCVHLSQLWDDSGPRSLLSLGPRTPPVARMDIDGGMKTDIYESMAEGVEVSRHASFSFWKQLHVSSVASSGSVEGVLACREQLSSFRL
jgi:hypothetical protein